MKTQTEKYAPRTMDLIKGLEGRQLYSIIERIIAEYPNIEQLIYELAFEMHQDFTVQTIADDVKSTLSQLDVEETYDYHSPYYSGYMDQTEIASEIFDEAIEPFFTKLLDYHNLGMHDLEKVYCTGIILGLRNASAKEYDMDGLITDDIYYAADQCYETWLERHGKDAKILEIEIFESNSSE